MKRLALVPVLAFAALAFSGCTAHRTTDFGVLPAGEGWYSESQRTVAWDSPEFGVTAAIEPSGRGETLSAIVVNHLDQKLSFRVRRPDGLILRQFDAGWWYLLAAPSDPAPRREVPLGPDSRIEVPAHGSVKVHVFAETIGWPGDLHPGVVECLFLVQLPSGEIRFPVAVEIDQHRDPRDHRLVAGG